MNKHEFKNSVVYNSDCVEGMKQYPDKTFHLAICDIPYGLGGKRLSARGGKHKNSPFAVLYKQSTQWDVLPNAEYFEQLFRVSRNQILFGANYFIEYLHSTRGFIVWDKNQSMPTFSACELIWTSFDKPSKIFKKRSTDLLRFHPTQKPVSLYEWLLINYAKTGDKILDSHLGSQSSRIACYKNGFDFTGFETDIDYFNQGNKRFENFTKQLTLF